MLDWRMSGTVPRNKMISADAIKAIKHDATLDDFLPTRYTNGIPMIGRSSANNRMFCVPVHPRIAMSNITKMMTKPAMAEAM